jgi:hypothetical protein
LEKMTIGTFHCHISTVGRASLQGITIQLGVSTATSLLLRAQLFNWTIPLPHRQIAGRAFVFNWTIPLATEATAGREFVFNWTIPLPHGQQLVALSFSIGQCHWHISNSWSCFHSEHIYNWTIPLAHKQQLLVLSCWSRFEVWHFILSMKPFPNQFLDRCTCMEQDFIFARARSAVDSELQQ